MVQGVRGDGYGPSLAEGGGGQADLPQQPDRLLSTSNPIVTGSTSLWISF